MTKNKDELIKAKKEALEISKKGLAQVTNIYSKPVYKL